MEQTIVKVDLKAAKRNRSREVVRRFRKNKLAMLGLVIILIMMLLAIFADVIIDYSMAVTSNSSLRLKSPSEVPPFGTDAYGRNQLARIVHGARISLSLGFFTTFISLGIGGLLGAMCGYYGGIFDEIVMRLMDILLSIPTLLMAIAIVSTLGPTVMNLLIAITISQIPGFTRIVRSSVLSVVGEDYIDLRIIMHDVLPNAIGPIIVQGTMAIAQMILLAAGLSFIGLGVQPPTPEWGTMLNQARDYMQEYPYLVTIPGIAIAISAFSINLVGDGLRDALDPKLKN